MDTALDAGAPLQARLLAIARRESVRALAALAAPTAANVHAARKSIKRLRAWLRLLRAHIGAQYRLIDRLLRDAARQLGGRRDAEVAVQTLRSLRRARRIDAEHYRQLSALLAQTPPATASRDAATHAALTLLSAASVYIEELALPALDAAELLAALERTRRRCRRECKRAKSAPSAATLHDWRKWVKHLLTQAQWVQALLGVTDMDLDALKALGEDLGRHHDLAELQRRLEAAGLDRQPLVHLRLRDAVARGQQSLESRALLRGARLLR
ncbi:CHAD domain-containing protein [Sinimarinibacterium thermocellulolyticum]|uniref:CHAD domain-containing protein n=1 Tax=Sinimarinibacterium thermocellulolyticum TaxID=3170016 RepID=A0ABV2A638_9GAMM